MDALDRTIIAALQRNARISFRELGEQVGLSPNATADRVRRLERDGAIRGYTTLVDPGATGRTLVAYLDVRLKQGTPPERFEPIVRRLDAVTECAHVTGAFDYQLRLAVTDAAELDNVIRFLKAKAEVVESATRIVLRSVVTR